MQSRDAGLGFQITFVVDLNLFDVRKMHRVKYQRNGRVKRNLNSIPKTNKKSDDSSSSKIANLRIENWKKRRICLSANNSLDMKFYNNKWYINSSLKSSPSMISPIFSRSPIIVLHDDLRVIYKTLKTLFEQSNRRDFDDYFRTITLRTDKRFRVYPFITKKNRAIVFIETGIGSGGTNFVMEILSSLNIGSILKFGTCSALMKKINTNTIIFVEEAVADEGASQYTFDYVPNLAKIPRYKPYGELTQKLKKEFIKKHGFRFNVMKDEFPSRVLSTDAYESFDLSTDLQSFLSNAGIAGVEMECSTFFSNSQKFLIPVAAIISVARTSNMLLNKFKSKSGCCVKRNNIVISQVGLIISVLDTLHILESD